VVVVVTPSQQASVLLPQERKSGTGDGRAIHQNVGCDTRVMCMMSIGNEQ